MLKNNNKYTLRKFANIHFPGCKNLLIFSTPRSGSTLLMEMIAEQPGILPVREPLNLRRDYIRDTLRMSRWDEIYSEKNYERVVRYLQSFRYNLMVDSRFKREKPFSHTWHLFTNRLAYKLLHGMEHKVKELCRDLNGRAVILLRHPIPVSLSREELPRYEAFLNSEVSSQFTSDQLKFAKDIWINGTVFEKSVVSWCFQNKLLLKNSDKHLIVTYEELVMNREPVIQKIADYFNLPDIPKMISRSLTPSGSTGKSTDANKELLKNVHRGEATFSELVTKWNKKTDGDMLTSAQTILDTFQIDIYTSNEIMPETRYLISPVSSGNDVSFNK